ncbi:glycoside hydrolase family 15 protein [Microbacterium azadirachtae]|uniref:glycoside hydrolase family 15 protein n=1 Tax=Microbacterium azadirachtae TaxID=582680 RepID=UPI00088D0832|nr:glycoside hydrolase family 15 protein [Microbacterium azadirachtae]SDL76418.1 Glucoamylase (glucan-1,4-alpha-glucosidase), GH15 family [Microbacterium azadirachtae]SEG05648.1 Glucoamylase (glucan-1,4-alpha-glucosidase), GH15 family [Microbacterium azadirachtae]SEG08233.1 Glucoamylase (glucan-1,4-alpha-glucosidase), GH15 family [Microbacterium azadirachtae]
MGEGEAASAPIEDYALLSDGRTAALVSRAGSIDWLCAPRLDSASLFGALLGGVEQGHWTLRPEDPDATAIRRYDGDTFCLVTRWETADGVAEVTEWMPIVPSGDDRPGAGQAAPEPEPARSEPEPAKSEPARSEPEPETSEAPERPTGDHAGMAETAPGERADVIRRITGIRGTVRFVQELRIRFDYARALPWIHQTGSASAPQITATAGPDAVVVRGAALRPSGHSHTGEITVGEGETADLVLTWFPSYRRTPDPLDVDASLRRTAAWWREWAAGIAHSGPQHEAVRRSLLILRALTNRDTGGIAAAATTSLPEDFGGVRNWDYRYVWLRDAALTLEALLAHGLADEARAWRDWLVRAVAGDPADVQIMYGLAGERELIEREMPSLPGYAGSAPVRIGNDAARQYQADVIGEVMVTLAAARRAGLAESARSWSLQRLLLGHVEELLDRPDNGMWEIRGDPQFFTHSRVMLWAAFDRGVRAVEEEGARGPVERWRQVRDRLRAEVDEFGVHHGWFVQHRGTDEVDASLLLIPRTGFCAPDDPRMLATVERIEQTLVHDGLVNRYRTGTGVDGLPGGEHTFLACSFWLVEQYAVTGREVEARRLMDRLCGLRNDVGMLSEENDPVGRRQVGNTPQAFSHLSLVRAADALAAGRHRKR